MTTRVNDESALKKADNEIAVADVTDAARSILDIVLTKRDLVHHQYCACRTIFLRRKNYTVSIYYWFKRSCFCFCLIIGLLILCCIAVM
jgi:cation transport ATPase